MNNEIAVMPWSMVISSGHNYQGLVSAMRSGQCYSTVVLTRGVDVFDDPETIKKRRTLTRLQKI
jgi:hypothetical protein